MKSRYDVGCKLIKKLDKSRYSFVFLSWLEYDNVFWALIRYTRKAESLKKGF